MLIFQMARLLMLWKRYQDNWGENIRKFLIEIQILLATGKELSNDIGNYDVRNYQRYIRYCSCGQDAQYEIEIMISKTIKNYIRNHDIAAAGKIIPVQTSLSIHLRDLDASSLRHILSTSPTPLSCFSLEYHFALKCIKHYLILSRVLQLSRATSVPEQVTGVEMCFVVVYRCWFK